MHVVVAGASGFLGTHLSDAMRNRGHDVTALVRRPSSARGESSWDPYAGTYDPEVVETADVVVNLAGAPTLGNPHSARWRRELLASRVATTRVLAGGIARSDRRPALIAGNGISYYGDHRDLGDPVLTETSESRGDAMLTRVAREWEAATLQARDASARVCVLRTAPVMDRRSAPLKQLRLLFKAGLGARLGDGMQHMPMISLRDWVGATVHLAEHASASGPFNVCCPTTPTNAEFTREIAKQLHRPAVLPAPAAAIRLGAGPMAPELLGSLNVRPAALEAAGYRFQDPDVRAVLRAGLS